MNFFSNLLSKIKAINTAHKQRKTYIFGTIMSGGYTYWKKDPHPTILCLGCYSLNGATYVHGIQLHALGSDLPWLMNVINSMKANGVVTNPRLFFNYIKQNNPRVVKAGYRTYIEGATDFKIINPGISNVSEDYCYPISDNRDFFLKKEQEVKHIINADITSEQLRKNISMVVNTYKVW